MRILIAEDDWTSRIALAGVLKKNGYEVITTVNGAEAWEALQQPDSPRLAILDWMMPEMDGLEVVRRVRALPTELPPYLILLTAKDGKSDIVTGLDAGANDYLAKPFDPGELRARVEVGRRMVEMQDALCESRERLQHQATHDPLTGLLNRRAILDHLHRELARQQRHGGAMAVGVGDIDHFKRFNDTYGHQTGDDILIGLAGIMTGYVREYDAVGRIGGEEFLIVVPLGSGHDPVAPFLRLCTLVAQTPVATKAGELCCTLSIGVTRTILGCSVDEILEAADSALYRAKHGGRNRVLSQELRAKEAGDAHSHCRR
jgi:diguanylate cyclase (GGDEF)-like protein